MIFQCVLITFLLLWVKSSIWNNASLDKGWHLTVPFRRFKTKEVQSFEFCGCSGCPCVAPYVAWDAILEALKLRSVEKRPTAVPTQDLQLCCLVFVLDDNYKISGILRHFAHQSCQYKTASQVRWCARREIRERNGGNAGEVLGSGRTFFT